MSRQQLRAADRKAQKEKTKIYNFTESQLKEYIKNTVEEETKKHHEEIMNDAINTSMTLMLTIPLEVLMDHYWKKSYEKKIPEFTAHVLDYYERWQNGELDMDKLREDLWEYGGIRLEAEE